MVWNLTKSRETDKVVAGVVFFLFAIADPMVKLGLMGAGEHLRHNESTVRLARNCIITVRVISKWASPIFILMIFFHCQFLAMNDDKNVGTKAALDLGWMGYSGSHKIYFLGDFKILSDVIVFHLGSFHSGSHISLCLWGFP